MPWAIAAAAVGAVGSYAASSAQASGQKSAADKASATARLGFDYLKGSPLGTSYLPTGGAANDAISSLLGVPSASTHVDEAATKQKILQALQANVGQGYDASFVQRVKGMIDSGAPLGAINDTLSAWSGSTTSKHNALAVGGIMGAVNNPVTAANDATGGGQANTAFNNYLKSTGYQFQLDQGSKAISGNAATRGVLNSGATGKALTEYGTNLASTHFDNYLKQLGDVANRGLSAGAAIGGAGSQAGATGAGAIARGYGDAATSRGDGIAGLAGAVAGGLNNYATSYRPPPTYSGGGGYGSGYGNALGG